MSTLYIFEQKPNTAGICQVCHKTIYAWEPHIFNFHVSCLKLVKETKTKYKFRTPEGGMIVIPKNYKFQEIIKLKW